MSFLRRIFRRKGVTTYLAAEQMEAITDHFDRFFGPVDDIEFHEMVSDEVHIDLYTISDVPGKDYAVIFTTGMSALPMPGAPPHERYAEMFVLVPKGWQMDHAALLGETESQWPFSALKMMARIPTTYGVAMTPGISMPNGDPAENFLGSEFCGLMCGRPDMLDPAFGRADLGGRAVTFFPVIPLLKSEMEWKMHQESPTALLDHWDAAGVDPIDVAVVNPKRTATV